MIDTELKTEQVLYTREGNGVLRNHASLTHDRARDTVGLHTAGVTQLLYILFPNHVSTTLTRLLLFHDSAVEFYTSDIIGVLKKNHSKLNDEIERIEDRLNEYLQTMPEWKDLTILDIELFKYLDILEFHLWTVEQIAYGARSPKMIFMYDRSRQAVVDKAYNLMGRVHRDDSDFLAVTDNYIEHMLGYVEDIKPNTSNIIKPLVIKDDV